ncbi:MAG TPA: hypothetical protein VFW19_05860 [Allosphingosinicella sp.]|nr:hypothetical protein [Allosphingosinicella sp.]
MKRLLPLLAAAACVPSAAFAAPPAGPANQEKVNALIIYGSDPCPRGQGDEIVVCARKPESERYRIPPNLRGDPNDPHNQAWANRAESLEYVGRSGIDSCSPSGPGGVSGCLTQFISQAKAERGQTDVNMVRLIEQAREQRNTTISTEASEGSKQPDPGMPPPPPPAPQ